MGVEGDCTLLCGGPVLLQEFSAGERGVASMSQPSDSHARSHRLSTLNSSHLNRLVCFTSHKLLDAG